MIAKQLGVPTPAGNKTETITWAEAIVEYQSKQQPIEVVKVTATIQYDDSVEGSCDGEYCVVVNGVVVRRFRTYAKAEAWAKDKYEIVDPQTEAQNELETYIEEKADEIVASGEKEDYPEKERPGRISITAIDFGHYEVIADGQCIATIEHISDLKWQVNCNGIWLMSYDEAIEYVTIQHKNGVAKLTESTGDFDEDRIQAHHRIESIFSDEFGGIFAIFQRDEYSEILLGYIRLNYETGWECDQLEGSFNSWHKAASHLVEVEVEELIYA
jgi:hypothetical protein